VRQRIAAVLVAVGRIPRRPVLFVAAVAVLAMAFYVTPIARRPGLPFDLLLFGFLAPLGWVLAWTSVSSWRLGIATYLLPGILTLVLLAIPEGLDYFPDHLNDADSMFWKVFVPVMCWPQLILVELGVLAMR
jgi:hypothetical protein